MLPTTILVDGAPRCVVRPTDAKALSRFMRNGKDYLLGKNLNGAISHRLADAEETAKWHEALAFHQAWGGAEEDYFGIPL